MRTFKTYYGRRVLILAFGYGLAKRFVPRGQLQWMRLGKMILASYSTPFGVTLAWEDGEI